MKKLGLGDVIMLAAFLWTVGAWRDSGLLYMLATMTTVLALCWKWADQ